MLFRMIGLSPQASHACLTLSVGSASFGRSPLGVIAAIGIA
jgi:hypothetical protein